jgi:hypothetical protein
MTSALMAQEVVSALKSLDTAGPVASERRHGRLDMDKVMSCQILWITATGVAAAFPFTLVAVGFIGMFLQMVPTRNQPLVSTRLAS